MYLREWIIKLGCIGLIVLIVEYCGLLTHLFEWDYDTTFNYPAVGAINSEQGKRASLRCCNFTFVHSALKKCSQNDSDLWLTLVVKSAVGNTHRRASIRRTWGVETRFSDVSIRRLFMLGISSSETQMQLVSDEAQLHGDIIQANFVDSYYNNTIKTLMAMQWSVRYCSRSQYFLFVDDDYYVSMKNILRFIGKQSRLQKSTISSVYSGQTTEFDRRISMKSDSAQELFAGFVMQTAPHRHKFSKWYTPLEEYPFDKWPPYVTAGAFVLSQKTLHDLHASSLHTRIFRFDDIYLGIVSLKAKVTLTHCKMFHFGKATYSGPDSYRHVVASHGYDDSAEMERVWEQCRSAGFA